MTLYLPLDETKPLPPSPSFLFEPTDHDAALSSVFKAIMKAKRIVVVCGAGISVQAGIPDFRSPAGLFQTLKRDHPKENLSSGKDLFDASVFNSEQMTALFCQMIAQLSDMSSAASPTPFHRLLRALDDSGKLLRVYTQNIDAIEAKSGLSFGVPAFDNRRHRPRTNPTTDPGGHTSLDPPRCVPLHGTLTRLYCMTCTYSCALTEYLPSLAAGAPPLCPSCSDMAVVRAAAGKRARAIGKLRPSVVLYGEAHADAEGVGDVVRRDLTGTSKGSGRSGPDLLLVVGTSLRVPGTKRIVREFAKAVRAAAGVESLPSPRGTPGADAPITSVYLNLDFPAPAREWGDVFDVWLQGDAQTFAGDVHRHLDEEARGKAAKAEKKQAREDAARKREETVCNKGVKRKAGVQGSTPAKRRRVDVLPTPPRTPKATKRKSKTAVPSDPSCSKAVPTRRIGKAIPTPTSGKLTVRIPARAPLSPAASDSSSGSPPAPATSSSTRRSSRLLRPSKDETPVVIKRRPRSPQPPPPRLVPEVVIPHAAWLTPRKRSAFSRGRPPPTPEGSPSCSSSCIESDAEDDALINVGGLENDSISELTEEEDPHTVDEPISMSSDEDEDVDIDVEAVDEEEAGVAQHLLRSRDLYGSSDDGHETGSDTDTDEEIAYLPYEAGRHIEGTIPIYRPPSSVRYVDGNLLLGRTVPLEESYVRTSGHGIATGAG